MKATGLDPVWETSAVFTLARILLSQSKSSAHTIVLFGSSNVAALAMTLYGQLWSTKDAVSLMFSGGHSHRQSLKICSTVGS